MHTTYLVRFICNECSDLHPMRFVLPLEDGPPARASMSATYAGKALPALLANVGANTVTCPKTGKLTSQKDNDDECVVFVVVRCS
jgi:hypothetical protein